MFNLIKVFWSKITHTFCKRDRSINISNICSIGMKRSRLQNRVSIFMLKSFMRSTPCLGLTVRFLKILSLTVVVMPLRHLIHVAVRIDV